MLLNVKEKVIFLTIIILMCMLGLIATDIYVPVMPVIAKSFNVKSTDLQLTISSYFVGLAISQLIYGPLTERFGRKLIALIGVSIFCIASFSCAFAPNIKCLIVLRFFQAVGGCSGTVLGRAIITDVYSKEKSGRVFATIFPFVGLSPAIAPVIGSMINIVFGWRMIFSFVGIIGLILLILIKYKLPETKDLSIKSPLKLTNIAKSYWYLLRQRVFWGFVIAPCSAYIAYFAYISESPFIFAKLGYSSKITGFFYINLSVSYVIGNLVAKKLLAKIQLAKVLLYGYYTFVLGGAFMLIFNYCLDDKFALFSLLFPVTILTFANGFLLPLGSSAVVSNFPQIAGYASSLLGFLQLGSAAFSATFIGKISNNNAINLSLYIFICTAIGLSLYYYLIVLVKKE